jgi:hypothetical protein
LLLKWGKKVIHFKGIKVKQEDTKQAAQALSVDDFVQEAIDQDSKKVETDSQLAESATADQTDTQELDSTEAEKPKEDGFQKRIDKVTEDKYKEKRRADDLQTRIDALEAASSKEQLKKPTLNDPDIDYDDEKFEKANRDYEIAQGVSQSLAKHKTDADAVKQKAKSDQVVSEFNERVVALGKSDFDAKANAIPNLPAGVADAIMQSELGAEMVYHLGSIENAEFANNIASMSPLMAMSEIGKLSVKLSSKPAVKPSAAPDPIEGIRSGGALNANIGDEMSTADWFNKFG